VSRLLLASRSPRRRSLLRALGLKFRAVTPGIDESGGNLPPEAEARLLAWEKARSLGTRARGALVVSADTIVVLDGRILGKPRSRAEARRMLRSLSGRTHTVITAVAMLDSRTGEGMVRHSASRVTMRRLSGREISSYVATGKPMDKAGAYGVQDRMKLVKRVRGDWFNVMGLPVRLFARMAAHYGWRISPARLSLLYQAPRP
jgi:MAF protein